MLFKVNSSNFINWFSRIASISPTTSISIFHLFVKLSIKENKIEGVCLNQDISFKSIFNEVEVTTEGELIINTNLLNNILIRCKNNEEITFEKIDQNIIKISCGKYISSISLVDVEFPQINFLDKPEGTTNLKYTCVKYISDNITNFSFDGKVSLIVTKDKIKTICGQNNLVAYYEVDNSNQQEFSILLPSSGLKLLQKTLLDENDCEIFLNTQNNIKQIFIYHNTDTYILNIIEGQARTINKILQTQFTNNFSVKKNDLENAINNVSVLNSETIKLTLKEKELSVSCTINESGTIDDEVNLIGEYKGSETIFTFYVKHILPSIKNIVGDDINFSFNDAESPILIEPKNFPVKIFLNPIKI